MTKWETKGPIHIVEVKAYAGGTLLWTALAAFLVYQLTKISERFRKKDEKKDQ